MIPRTQVADDAGALLVRSGLVSSSALDEARLRVMQEGGTVGEQLVASGVLTDEALTEFYRQRLLVPAVNPNSLARLPSKIVALIPGDLAVELRVVPVSLDSDNNLTVAMSDPSDRHAVDEIGFFTSAYVVRAVATQMQIAWCLAHYYGHVTQLGERLLKPETPAAPPAPQRKKGITDQVKALRTKRVERGALMVSDVMAELGNVGDSTRVQPTTSDEEPTPVDTPSANAKPRGRTASGEIRVPSKRAPSIKPPLPDDSGPILIMEAGEPSGPVVSGELSSRDSEPVITIEASSRDSEPVITIEAEPPWHEDETVRKMSKPRRKRPAEPDPPELAARAGEVQLATGEPVKAIDFDVPSIMISDELERVLRPSISGELRHREPAPEPTAPTATISVELGGPDSEPVLLDRRRNSDPPTNTQVTPAAPEAEIAAEDEISDVVVLELKKPTKRIDRITQVGMGPVPVATTAKFTAMTGIPVEAYDDSPTDARRTVIEPDETRVDTQVAPAGDYTSSSDELLAPPPPPGHYVRDTLQVPVVPPPSPSIAPPPSGAVSFDRVQRAPTSTEEDDEDDVKTRPTAVMSAVELDAVIPGRMSDPLLGAKRAPAAVSGEIDDGDGWGAPGTTIPPPLLGAIPGALEPTSGIIPLPDVDSAPLMVTPPSPPESMARPRTASEQGASRVLEEATARVLELIHTLDHATERDQVIAVLIAHLAESHQRAGFFAARNGELSLFAITPRVPAMPVAALRLDRASTLQDVVGTRLPYRGPMHDDASRTFLQSTLGACPPELLLVPIAVRERVVGVLFGDHRVRHTFDDQLALAARAAGMALERILKARRG